MAKETGVPEMDKGIIIDKDLINLISLLNNNYKIGLLLNSSSVWIDEILRENNLNKYFNSIIISEKVGFIKSDPRIFQIALARLKSKPEETLFIADREGHVKASEELGPALLVFTG